MEGSMYISNSRPFCNNHNLWPWYQGGMVTLHLLFQQPRHRLSAATRQQRHRQWHNRHLHRKMRDQSWGSCWMLCIQCQYIFRRKERPYALCCLRSWSPGKFANQGKALINEIPVFLTAWTLLMNCTLSDVSGAIGHQEQGKGVYTMSATRAHSWTVTRQGVEWTITCERVKMLELEFMLSLIFIEWQMSIASRRRDIYANILLS